MQQRQQSHGTLEQSASGWGAYSENKNEIIITKDAVNKWRREDEKSEQSVNATVVRSPCGYVKHSPVLITSNRLWFHSIELTILSRLHSAMEMNIEKHHFAWFDGWWCFFFVHFDQATNQIYTQYIAHKIEHFDLLCICIDAECKCVHMKMLRFNIHSSSYTYKRFT